MLGKGHLVGAPRARVPKRHDARPERSPAPREPREELDDVADVGYGDATSLRERLGVGGVAGGAPRVVPAPFIEAGPLERDERRREKASDLSGT